MQNLFAIFVVLLVVLFGMGCATSPGILHVAAPVTLPSATSDVSEVIEICNSYRARYQRNPVFLADGTPVWCF